MRAYRPTTPYSRSHGLRRASGDERHPTLTRTSIARALRVPHIGSGSSVAAVVIPDCRKRRIVRRGVTLGVVAVYAWMVV